MKNIEKRIVLFANDMATKAEHPTHRGNVTVNGTLFYISMWKHTKDERTFLGGKANIAGSTEDMNDIVIFAAPAGSKHLLEGNLVIYGVQYDIKMYSRKSKDGKTYWEGSVTKHEIAEENASEELPF